MSVEVVKLTLASLEETVENLQLTLRKYYNFT